MGRNTFGGWWGDEPPYHAPVFVLTHHGRAPPAREGGGTTFTFVTGGIEAAPTQAQDAAGGKAVDVAGGAATVRQFLVAGLFDELLRHVTPVLGRPPAPAAGPRRRPRARAGRDDVGHGIHLRYRVMR